MDSLDIEIMGEWKLRNYSVKLKLSAPVHPAHPYVNRIVLQADVLEVTGFCIDSDEREASRKKGVQSLNSWIMK